MELMRGRAFFLLGSLLTFLTVKAAQADSIFGGEFEKCLKERVTFSGIIENTTWPNVH